MTTETQQGVAKIFGLKNGAQVTLTGAATITMDKADLEHTFALDEDAGQDGNIETLLAYDERLNVTIDFAPNGATRAAAITSAANSWPDMITKVTLSGFDVAKLNGKFNYIGGAKVTQTRKGWCVMGIKLRAYVANRDSLTNGVIVG